MAIKWIETQNMDPETKREHQRTFELSTGSKLHFKRQPNQRFWTINFDQGTLPEQLTGRYITFSRALAAATDYFNSHPQRKIKIKEEVIA